MSQKQQGTVRKWQDEKGFGFIETQAGEQLFFHISEYKTTGRPQANDKVIFISGQDAQGRVRAKQVESIKANSKPAHKRSKPKSRRQSDYEQQQTAFKLGQRIRVAIGLGFYLLLLSMAGLDYLPWLIVGWYGVLGLMAFMAYASDKAAAQQQRWRTKESTLHLLSLLGGWVGAMLAQAYLRHKSKKAAFQQMFYVTVIINLAVLYYLIMHPDVLTTVGGILQSISI